MAHREDHRWWLPQGTAACFYLFQAASGSAVCEGWG